MIWVYLSEIFPNRVRAKGQSLGSFTHWFMNALIAWTFPQIAKTSGAAPFMLFCDAMMALQFFVVLFVFPETKGLSLEQMQKKTGHRLMKNFLLGFVLALVVVLLGALVYFGLGLAPVAASAPPMPFERLVAGMALHARISKEAPSQAPIPAGRTKSAGGRADLSRAVRRLPRAKRPA